MNNFKILSVLFLFLFLSCGKNREEANPQKQGLDISFPEVTFTDYLKVARREASPIIMNRLISLVNSSVEKSDIHISIFGCDYPALTTALKNAARRNVKVFLMLDMSSDDTAKENLKIANELKNIQGIEVTIVTNDAGTIAINHNKFAIFSNVLTNKGEVNKIVFQTSHNFTVADSRKIQDAVTLQNDGLYAAFKQYWLDMKVRAKIGMKHFEYREYSDVQAGIEVYFLPKRKVNAFYGDDTIIEILNDITDPATATIRVGMSGWADSRLNIVEQLEMLLDKGAKVQVITKPGIGVNIERKLNELQAKGAEIKIYAESKINIHSKFMLIEGDWRGKKANIVVNGSQNFTSNALRYNNEVTLLLLNSQIYQAYDSFYKNIMELPE